MTTTKKTPRDMLRESLANHRLVELVRTTEAVVFSLQREGTRNMSTMITFTREGIVLQGDLTPQTYGSVSAKGYGERWFASKLSVSYLCEKFLQRKFRLELFKHALGDSGWRCAAGISEENANQIASETELECGCDAYGKLMDLGLDPDTVPGVGYDPREADVLCEIQRRFAELHREIYGDQVPEIRVPERS